MIEQYLIIANVVVELVNAFPIPSVSQCMSHILNIWNAVHYSTSRPVCVALGDRVQVNYNLSEQIRGT